MTRPDPVNVVYIAEFIDGPLEGHIDSRVLVQGKHARRISMVAAVDSLESLFWYNEVDERDVQGQLRVRYSFDAQDSDPVESNGEPD